MTRSLIPAIAVLFCASCSGAHDITVHNESSIDRNGDIVELDISKLPDFEPGKFRIVDAAGTEVPYQQTHTGAIIFPATVKSYDDARYRIVNGTPAPVDTAVYGRLVPERLDDMAWENDLCAYRAYGPALQKTGEQAFGYDIWTKSVHHPVINKRYYDHIHRNISFHEDHGEGMDVYAVGPTLGGGTAALLDSEGKIVYPYCYETHEILDNGPLRFTVKLTYGAIAVDNDSSVVETRIISLDKGDFLNSTTVCYSGLSSTKTIMPGIVVHRHNPDAYAFDSGKGYMAYADLTQNAEADNGTIFVGIVSPASKNLEYKAFDEPVGDAIGHITAPADYKPGKEFTYWWGASWSKGFTPDMKAWTDELEKFVLRKQSPLTVTID